MFFENVPIKLKLTQIVNKDSFHDYREDPNYKQAKGVIVVYDISNRDSFINLNNWFNKIDEYCNEEGKICKILVGNKNDTKDRRVKEEEGKNLANEKKMAFFEVSSKTNDNVNQIFVFLANKILRYEQNKI